MTQPIARILIAAWIAGAALLIADEQKCNGSARECEQQIRQFLGGRRFLGATIRDKNPGLVVEAVTPGGPAARAGLQVGDRLITCNSKTLTAATARDFKQILADARENGRVRMIVSRRARYEIIDARLEPYTKEQIEKIIAAHLSQSHPSSAGAHR
ncbi:MAG: PDZ domain-containing protein [Thermoanaerobaculia bacterium]